MTSPDTRSQQINHLRVRIANLEQQLDEARLELKVLETLKAQQSPATEEIDPDEQPPRQARITHASTSDEKLQLFRSRFRGREDAFAHSWVNQRKGTKGWAPRTRTWVAPKDVTASDLLPLTDKVVYEHLSATAPGSAHFHLGLYPLLPDEHCYLLACDFDKGTWKLDAQAYAWAARNAGFDTLTEVSRSGNGAHVWLFFSEKIPAIKARALGARLIRSAMEQRAGIPLDSYDRLFPAQDTLPLKSAGHTRLGNLIALPLEGDARKEGRTVFVDPADFSPVPDPFAALDLVRPAAADQVASYLRRAGEESVGPRVSMELLPPRGRRAKPKRLVDNVPLVIVRDCAVRIPLTGMPSAVITELKHIASQHNPEFYRRQAQRLSTFGVPRLVQCFEATDEELVLPRGVLDESRKLLIATGFRVSVKYRGQVRKKLGLAFHGTLREAQQEAFDAISPHREGVIVAPTGSGKTVVACALIAARDIPTAVLVNNTQLLGQWRSSLARFLDWDPEDIGQLGDGKQHLTGKIDLVMIQSIRGRNADPTVLDKYGQIIVDECHSIAAPSTLAAVGQVNAARWVGLTATPYRADELNGLITMQCGPIRYDLDSPLAATRELLVHHTDFEPESNETDGAGMQELYNEIAHDEQRNRQIAKLIEDELRDGRHCLVLSNRTQHIHSLTELVQDAGIEAPVIGLHGQLGKKKRKEVTDNLQVVDAAGFAYVVIASDKIAGEGFNLPGLDTLFLVSPVSFKGKVEQLIGRIQRTDDAERVIRIHDFVDTNVGVFEAMARRRHRVIRKRGFNLSATNQTTLLDSD